MQCSVKRVLPQSGERLLGDLRPGEQSIFAAARPPHDEAAAAGCVSEANGRELPLRSGQAAVSRRLYLRFGSGGRFETERQNDENAAYSITVTEPDADKGIQAGISGRGPGCDRAERGNQPVSKGDLHGEVQGIRGGKLHLRRAEQNHRSGGAGPVQRR